tara:strand:+ start:368 stop:847 length:480 start_codon:yes stop_codon:yes gene_type:complete
MAGVFGGVLLLPALLWVPGVALLFDYKIYRQIGLLYSWLILMSVAAQFWWFCGLSGKGPADVWRPVLVLQICVVIPIHLTFPAIFPIALIREIFGVDLVVLFWFFILPLIALVIWLPRIDLFASLGGARKRSLYTAITVTALFPAVFSIILAFIALLGV